MRRAFIGLLAASLLAVPATATAHDETSGTKRGPSLSFSPIVQEWDFDGNAMENPPRVGWSVLLRRNRRLDALAQIRGLKPGGVYTFWWVVVQEDGTFPDDIFLAGGAARVVNEKGRTTVHMKARLGQDSIEGFMPDGVNELQFAPLSDTRGSIVRIEIAYHGQAKDAGGDLDVWLGDFWTGTACPPDTPNPNPTQPHCPIYYATTHG